jgi:predicted ATP-grasp superfamily ATP-dependent carboligase
VGVRLVRDEGELRAAIACGKQFRLEVYQPGLPASVSVLTGPGRLHILPACRQLLSDDGQFRYLGGRAPLSADLCRRAESLGRAVAAVLPSAVGYFGIDLVLGDEADGSADVVIEVNPRLTTSYVGLRRIARMNLAEAMLLAARGEQVDLSFDPGPVQFAADGELGK